MFPSTYKSEFVIVQPLLEFDMFGKITASGWF